MVGPQGGNVSCSLPPWPHSPPPTKAMLHYTSTSEEHWDGGMNGFSKKTQRGHWHSGARLRWSKVLLEGAPSFQAQASPVLKAASGNEPDRRQDASQAG